MMTEDEYRLWARQEESRKELILYYLPMVEAIAKRIARSAHWTNWEDLKQEGVIGLINAVLKFDPQRGTSFKAFARHYIKGAIYDSSELTRNMTRQQHDVYRRIRRAEDKLEKMLQRNPRIEEVAKETGLTHEQIQNAIDAVGVAFAGGFPDTEEVVIAGSDKKDNREQSEKIYQAIAGLSKMEQSIIQLHYLEGQTYEKIAEKLGIIPDEVIRIRERAVARVTKKCQRAVAKICDALDVKKKGKHGRK